MTQDFAHPEGQNGGYQENWSQSPQANTFNPGYPIVQNSPNGSHSSSYQPNSPGYYNSAGSLPSTDNLVHQSPKLSPGDWQVASPQASSVTTSPYDSSQASNSPSSSSGHSLGGRSYSSAPPGTLSSVSSASMGESSPPRLPSELGKNERIENSELWTKKDGKKLVIKEDLDLRREKIAAAKALKLMNKTLGVGREEKYKEVERPKIRSGSLSAREAAIRRYEEKSMQVVIEGGPVKPKPAPVSVHRGPKEELAKSNRKKKTSAEALETVHDLKCQLDHDRERYAKRKALDLLDEFKVFA